MIATFLNWVDAMPDRHFLIFMYVVFLTGYVFFSICSAVYKIFMQDIGRY